MSQSGQQIARDNVAKFTAWVAEREATLDWKDYLRNGRLNRKEIAAECGFALSVLRQNPAAQKMLQDLENELMSRGIINAPTDSNGADDTSSKAVDSRIMAAKARAEARVKDLEEKNAALTADVRDLRDKLKRYEHIDDHLGRTGRLIRE